MNERIKELANKADYYANEHYGVKGIPYSVLFNQKFAELIVGECIDIISPYAVRMEDFDGGHPIADLKKHFGVE